MRHYVVEYLHGVGRHWGPYSLAFHRLTGELRMACETNASGCCSVEGGVRINEW